MSTQPTALIVLDSTFIRALVAELTDPGRGLDLRAARALQQSLREVFDPPVDGRDFPCAALLSELLRGSDRYRAVCPVESLRLYLKSLAPEVVEVVAPVLQHLLGPLLQRIPPTSAPRELPRTRAEEIDSLALRIASPGVRTILAATDRPQLPEDLQCTGPRLLLRHLLS